MRRVMAAVALVASALMVVVACSDASTAAGNANAADVEAVIAQVSNGNVVNKSQATCIADRAVPKLSTAGLRLARDTSKDIAGLSKADQAVVYQSFDACVTTAQLAPAISKALTTGATKDSAKSATCFASKLAAKFPRSGDLVKAMQGGDASAVTASVSACIPSEQIEQSLVDSMTSGGYTKAQATCVVDKVLAEVPLRDFTDNTTGSLPADVQTKIVAATQACQSAG